MVRESTTWSVPLTTSWRVTVDVTVTGPVSEAADATGRRGHEDGRKDDTGQRRDGEDERDETSHGVAPSVSPPAPRAPVGDRGRQRQDREQGQRHQRRDRRSRPRAAARPRRSAPGRGCVRLGCRRPTPCSRPTRSPWARSRTPPAAAVRDRRGASRSCSHPIRCVSRRRDTSPRTFGVAPIPFGVTPAAHGPAPTWSQAGGSGAIWAR